MTLLIATALAACSPAVTPALTERTCDEAIELVYELPPELVSRGNTVAVGSGDTWFLPPSRGKWADDVRWDAGEYFLKLGIWTLSSQPPNTIVQEVGGSQGRGKASFFPTSAGLPGPLPARLTFPTPGCWDVTAVGVTGRAHARIWFDASARDRR